MISDETDAVDPGGFEYGRIRTRPETAADATFLRALHTSVKAADFAMMHVAEPVRLQLLDMQFQAMTSSYRAAFPDGSFAIITLDELPIGRLITNDGADRFTIVYIALLPEWRQRRISTMLMTQVLGKPRRTGMPCEATVALDNQASRSLWSGLGFTERERDGANIVLEWRPEGPRAIQAARGEGRRPPPARNRLR